MEDDEASFFMKIQSQFKDAKYQEDIVISFTKDAVLNIQGKARPFLRVIFTENESFDVRDDFKNRLAVLRMDIEVLVIREFIPEKK